MHALVIYDSNFGNTKELAKTIAAELHTKAIGITDVSEKDLEHQDLLVFGSPINGWRATEKMTNFLRNLHKHQLDGKKAATFDTRIKVFFHGDAAGKMASSLKSAGATIIAPSQGFYVSGQTGPLLEEEKEKAVKWADSLRDSLEEQNG